MPILFVALQCCQCSTMQVKQQKKSSNKWTCVVCNQKQSVRKVFAQGFMAKDLRMFVQSFNMSRQSIDENELDLAVAPVPEDEERIVNCNRDPLDRKNKRTDWTEYIDLDDTGVIQKDEILKEDVSEPEILTSLPREMFKKPKLRNYSVDSSRGDADGRFRPVFAKRNPNKILSSQDVNDNKCHQIMGREKSKQNNYTKDNRVSTQCLPGTAKRSGSKWSCYITQDEDELQPRNEGKFIDYVDELKFGLGEYNGR